MSDKVFDGFRAATHRERLGYAFHPERPLWVATLGRNTEAFYGFDDDQVGLLYVEAIDADGDMICASREAHSEAEAVTACRAIVSAVHVDGRPLPDVLLAFGFAV